VQNFLKAHLHIDRVVANQLKRAALSVPLNLAEGSGRFTKPDRKNFYIIARSSVFECVAIFDILKDEGEMGDPVFQALYELAEEMSKMLFAMIQNLSKG
jgi:four helix bundle protein